MKLSLIVTTVPVPKVSGNVNDTTRHFQSREGYELERQKNGDVTVIRHGKLVGFVGASNVAYGEPLSET